MLPVPLPRCIRRLCSERSAALLLALVVSLAVHLLALFGTDADWLPAREPAVTTLDAELLTPLPPAPEPLPRKAPAKPSPAGPLPQTDASAAGPDPESPAAAADTDAAASAATNDGASAVGGDAASAQAQGDAGGDAPVAPPAPASTLPAKPVGQPLLPREGSLVYRLCRGTRGFEVGRVTVHWQFGDGRYVLTSQAETTGLVALFKQISIDMRSEGSFTEIGLQPERFIASRGSGGAGEGARFDWTTRQLTLTRFGSRSLPLSRGSQDLLSFPYQFAYLMPRNEPFDMGVVTGKKYASYHVQVLGSETIELAGRQYATLHLRAQGDDITDLWLASERYWLPVRIRHTDRKGEIFEQILADPAGEQK